MSSTFMKVVQFQFRKLMNWQILWVWIVVQTLLFQTQLFWKISSSQNSLVSGLWHRASFPRFKMELKTFMYSTFQSRNSSSENSWGQILWVWIVVQTLLCQIHNCSRNSWSKILWSGLLNRPWAVHWYNYLFRKFHEEKFFGLECCTDPPFPGTTELRKIHAAEFFDLDAA